MWRITQASDAFLKSRIPCTENLPAFLQAAAIHLFPLDRNRKGAAERWEQGLFQIPFPPGKNLSKTGWDLSWATSSLPFTPSSLALWESAFQLESSSFCKLMHTLPPLFWFSGYLLFKFLFSCCNASGCSLPPSKPCHSVMCADSPQWRRQGSSSVPYRRTQTRGHRKCWSISTILWAKHSKFPNLLIKKQYVKLLSPALSPATAEL